MAKTRSQQHLFAAAAKMGFPASRFSRRPPSRPPEAITAAPGVQLPFAARTNPTVAKKPVKWGRWAVAAAMLLALGGIGAIAAVLGADVESNLKTMRQWETTQAETRQQERNLNEQIRTTQVDGDKKVAGVYEAVKEREMKLTVQGPASVQPGAPSEYQITTKNLKDQPVATQVSVQMSDNGVKIGAPINAEAIDGKPGVYHVEAAARPASSARTAIRSYSSPPNAQASAPRRKSKSNSIWRRRSTSGRTWPPTSRCISPARRSTSAR